MGRGNVRSEGGFGAVIDHERKLVDTLEVLKIIEDAILRHPNDVELRVTYKSLKKRLEVLGKDNPCSTCIGVTPIGSLKREFLPTEKCDHI